MLAGTPATSSSGLEARIEKLEDLMAQWQALSDMGHPGVHLKPDLGAPRHPGCNIAAQWLCFACYPCCVATSTRMLLRYTSAV